jgi:hypothetical protein
MEAKEMLLLCKLFSSPPSVVEQEDARVIRLVKVAMLGEPEREVDDGE